MIGSNRVNVLGVHPTVGDLRRAREVLLDAGDSSSTNVADALGSILHGHDPVLALGLKATTGRRSALTADQLSKQQGHQTREQQQADS